MKLAVLSDTHYISRRMISPDNRTYLTDTAVTEASVLQAAEKCNVMLITGDLTNDGDRYSHEDFAEFLRKVKNKGVKIYTIFATHDYHHHRAYVPEHTLNEHYDSQPWNYPYFDKKAAEEKGVKLPKLCEALSPKEIWDTYYEFGVEGAYSVYAPGYSYCVDLDENTRCLMLNDIFRNEEALKDISASFEPGCYKWMKQMKDEADRDGKFIFACTHHPLAPVVPAHRLGAGNRDLRSPYTAHILADIGIELVLTGHTHAADADFLCSDSGNMLFTLMAPSVRHYPAEYRIIELDGKNKHIDYSCIPVEITPEMQVSEPDLNTYYRRQMYEDKYNSIVNKDNFVGKLLKKLTLKKLWFLCGKASGLSKKEFAPIADKLFFDHILDLVFNMLHGDGEFTPGTPEYEFSMGMAAVADSIVDAVPFVDIRNKLLKGYRVSEIFEEMLFTNGVSDRDDSVDFTKPPVKKYDTKPKKSHAGGILMAIIYVLAFILSPLAVPGIIIGLPVILIKKKADVKKTPAKLLMRYR